MCEDDLMRSFFEAVKQHFAAHVSPVASHGATVSEIVF
jgi:hypothetical protein